MFAALLHPASPTSTKTKTVKWLRKNSLVSLHQGCHRVVVPVAVDQAVLAVAPVPEADSVLHSNDAERPILLDKCNVTDRDGV
jgi:hypothetical protein